MDQVLVSSGAKQSCYNACLALLDPGDEAIVPAPYWVSYPDMVRLADAEPVILHTTAAQGFKITAEQLAGAITAKTRLLILNSPCNPTGAAYSAADYRHLGAVLREYRRVVILTDEIYEHIHWGPTPFTSFARSLPGSLRAHAHGERHVQSLCDERLAHGLRGGTGSSDQSHDGPAEPEHDERELDLAGGRGRGVERRSDVRAGVLCRVQDAARASCYNASARCPV